MPPCMPRNQDRLHLNVVDIKYVSVLQQDLAVVCLHHREFICSEYHPAADFPRQIPVFDLTQIECSFLKKTVRIPLHGANMVCILMGEKDVLYLCRINIQPSHFFLQAVIVITGIDHNCCLVFRIEEYIGNPFPDARHVLIYPAGIQGLEYLFPAVSEAHHLFLKQRCLSGHSSSLHLIRISSRVPVFPIDFSKQVIDP